MSNEIKKSCLKTLEKIMNLRYINCWYVLLHSGQKNHEAREEDTPEWLMIRPCFSNTCVLNNSFKQKTDSLNTNLLSG